jgi:hypothetical protein
MKKIAFFALSLFPTFAFGQAQSNVKISQLPSAATLTGTEQTPVVQNGHTVAATTYQIAALAIANSQPLDVDLSAIAAVSTQPFGRARLTDPDASTARNALGLGSNSLDSTPRLSVASNLSDLASASSARANLGVTATGADPAYGKLAAINIWAGSNTFNSQVVLGFNSPDPNVPLLRLTNPNGVGQSTLSYNINGTERARLRVDYVGNINYAAFGGSHNWYTGGDVGAGATSVATLSSTAMTLNVPLTAKAGISTTSITGMTTALSVAQGGTGRTIAVPALAVSRSNGNPGSFMTVGPNFTTIVLTTTAIDTASAYNTSTGIYTLPETGLYLITMKVRLADATPGGVSYGAGVDTSNGDGASFFWGTTAASGGQASRQGLFNSRLYNGTAGDQLRLFAYVDANGGAGVNSAELNVIKLR